MRERIFVSDKHRGDNIDEINKLKKALHVKEKKLLKKEETLQRKIKEYERRASSRAKADSRAATKLREARKKLLFALDSRDKLQTCNPSNCKAKRFQNKEYRTRSKGKGKTKKENPFTDVIFNFCDKLLSGPSKDNNVLKSTFHNIQRKPYSKRFQDHEPRSSRDHSTRREPQVVNVCNLAGGDCYLKSLHTTPQIWMYRRCPNLYPPYMNVRRQWKNMGYLMLFIAGFMLWSPMLVCIELCKCCFCACCCDSQ